MDTREKHKKDVLRLATFIGEMMLSNGAETYRIEDSVKRICASRGFMYVNVFLAPSTIIVSDDRFDGYTFMKVIKNRCINLTKVDTLNEFCRKFVSDTNITVDEAIQQLKYLEEMPTYSPITINIATAIGSSSFAVLAGGNDIKTFMLTLITAIIANLVYGYVMKSTKIPVFATAVASVIIAISGIALTESGVLETPTMLIVGSIMPLLPGVPFIKGIRDLVSGELMSGLGRAIDAAMIAMAIASGIGMVMNFYIQIGGVL